MANMTKTVAEKAYDRLCDTYRGFSHAMRRFQGLSCPEITERACTEATGEIMVEITKTFSKKQRDNFERSMAKDGYRALMYNDAFPRYSVVRTMAAWQTCKHVFRFDPTLAQALIAQDCPKQIPFEILDRAPYPILFVEAAMPHAQAEAASTDGHIGPIEIKELTARGFFFYRYRSDEDGDIRYEIEYLLSDCSLSGISLKKSDVSVEGFFERKYPGARESIPSLGREQFRRETSAMREGWERNVSAALNLLYYLVSENAEHEVVYKPTGLSKKPKVSLAEVHEVGRRIGAELCAAKAVYIRDSAPGKIGRTIAAHMRRGHFHHYWTGPKDGERTLIVHWLPPIAVNAGKDVRDAEKTPAIHRATA